MRGFRLGSIFGFEIRIDFSWFVIFFLILWTFTAGVFPSTAPGLSTLTYVIMGAVGTLLFFVSLLAHELSHSLVARANGIPIKGITLFIFGGVSETKSEAKTPGLEFLIAVVGPLMSFALGLLFRLVGFFGKGAGVTVAVTDVAWQLAYLNVILAVFNLLPGFPLDGGRLFRSAAWKATGDLTKATRWAAAGGRFLGYALIALGILQVIFGNLIGGLWLVFIGWFVSNIAASSYQQHLMSGVLDSARARDAMTVEPETVGPEVTIAALVDEYFLKRRYQAFPVTEGRRLAGIITLQQVKEVPRETWERRTVGQTMKSPVVVRPDDSMASVLERMSTSGVRRVLVASDGEVEGIITAHDVARWLDRERRLADVVGSTGRPADEGERGQAGAGDVPRPAFG